MDNKKQLSDWIAEKIQRQNEKNKKEKELLLQRLNELKFFKDENDKKEKLIGKKCLCGLISFETFKTEMEALHDNYIDLLLEIISIEKKLEGDF